MSGWLHAFDPTRPVHYEGAQGAQAGAQPGDAEPGAGRDAFHRGPLPANGVEGRGGTRSYQPDPPTVDIISRFYPRVMDKYLKADAPENTRWTRLAELAGNTNDKR